MAEITSKNFRDSHIQIRESKTYVHRVIYEENHGNSLLSGLRELFHYRELLTVWTQRDIKIRYKQSLLGAAWAILQPLSMMVVFSIVFGYLVRVPTGELPYPIFSYTALLPWTLFANSISFGVPSVVNNLNLVTKIYFPREILPLAAVMASFVDYLIASVIFLGMIFFYQVSLEITIFAWPLLLGVQLILTVGVVLLASAVNVFYRDIRFVVPLAVLLWMYATPIIYPVSLVPERWRTLYMLNPMAALIEGYRATILRGEWPHWENIGLAAAISILIFLAGYWKFKRMEVVFADVI